MEVLPQVKTVEAVRAVKKLLLVMADDFPTHRADLAVLFGKELPRSGISCDVVAQLVKGKDAADTV